MTTGSASKSPRSGRSTAASVAALAVGAWGAGLALTGLVQGLMVLTTGASVTDPAGMLTRTLVGLAGEALLAVAILIWLSGPRTGVRARREAAPPVSAADVPVPAPESADGPRPSE
jgi:hypothetical protein